ncbi:MAG: tyrosine-type recombinase/integrase [Fusicatenibacter sp.]
MAKKKEPVPQYRTVIRNGIQYYRKRVKDADGKWIDLYAKTCEELQAKEIKAKREIEKAISRRENPTVAEYSEKWLLMQSANIRESTLKNYTQLVKNYIIKPLGHLYMSEVTADDIRLAMLPASKKSAAVYSQVNMLIKCIFYSAEYSKIIDENPTVRISAKGGTPKKEREALTDEQVQCLLNAIKGLPPYVFVMIGLYAGLRREEILGLKWDCVFLDESTPYISVRRTWHSENNRPVISTELKTPAARRDIPIPKCLADCLKEAKEKSISEFVIADRNGEPLSYSQFQRVWKYIDTRSTKERHYYRYVNGQKIRHTIKPELGQVAQCNPNLVYCMDFHVTPHQLRHTYITNLIYAGVDPKTVQYLAGHENSKVTMDIYAKVKYNKPGELLSVVNNAFCQAPKS